MNCPHSPSVSPRCADPHQLLGAVLDEDECKSLLLQFALNLPLRIYRRLASKSRLSTTRDMKNKINLHFPKREAVLMGNSQVTAGNNKAVRKSQLLHRFPRFISVLGLIKPRGQEGY